MSIAIREEEREKFMKEQPLVSIVLPIYNQEVYLAKALDSLCNQTYRNIEIVCVNDGSTDGTQKIVDNYKMRDKRIVCIKKENGGLVDAVVTGVRHATGELLCFVDPDDYVGSEFVEFFVLNIEGFDVIAAGFFTNEDGIIKPKYLGNDIIYTAEEMQHLSHTFIISEKNGELSNSIFVSRWNKCYRTERVRSIIDKYEKVKNVSMGEDSIFTYLVLSESKSVKAVKFANSYYYNIRSQTSMMSNNSLKQYIIKSKISYDQFVSLLQDGNCGIALELYFCLMETIYNRLLNSEDSQIELNCLWNYMKGDGLYIKAEKYIMSHSTVKRKIVLLLRHYLKPGLFIMLRHIMGH